jgi:hypothetical protein
VAGEVVDVSRCTPFSRAPQASTKSESVSADGRPELIVLNSPGTPTGNATRDIGPRAPDGDTQQAFPLRCSLMARMQDSAGPDGIVEQSSDGACKGRTSREATR